MNQLDTIEELLRAIEAFVGYRWYTIRLRGTNWQGDEVYALDVHGVTNAILVHAERMGSLNEMYLYVAGMYRMLTHVESRMGIDKIS